MLQDLLQGLNQAQKKAVTHGDGPLLIVAGAGTGKTTVVTRRVAWLIDQQKAKPDEILALTFTDKAAGEMEERVEALLPYGYVDLWVSTFHSFGERILKDNALEIGLPPNFRLLNQTEQWLLVRENLDRFDLDYYRPLGNPTKFIQALISHFSRAKDEDISPDDYLDYAEKLHLDTDSAEVMARKKGKSEDEVVEISEAERIAEIAGAYKVYTDLLLESSTLDFGDLINYTLKLFRTRPKVLEKYRRQFKFILVDEFQDTNYAQYELIKLLAAPKNNLTVLGDDDQSIYAFRGASMSNILEFKKDFPESEEVVLTKNYRSQQNILDLSYNFIQLNNPNRLEYQLSNGKNDKNSDAELKKEISEKGGELKSEISKRLEAEIQGEGIIEHIHEASREAEARKVVERIATLKQDDKEANWSDFVILVRANDQADIFLNYLEREDIPRQFLASRGLYVKPIIVDLIAYLRLLEDYHESKSLFRVFNLPIFDIPLEDIINLNNYSYRKNLSLFETLKIVRTIGKISAESQDKFDQVQALILRHSELARTKSVGQVLISFLNESGYLKRLTKSKKLEDLEKIMYLNQFYKKIEGFEQASNDKSVKKFVGEMDLALESGEEGSLAPNWEEGPESVKIMTVHGAKGLEFKYVFVVNLVDKRFPSISRKEPIEVPEELVKEIIPVGDVHLQEERRLFYVACTRAKHGLFLTSGRDYGGVRPKKPSRFLVEAGFSVEDLSAKTGVTNFQELDTKPLRKEKPEKKSEVTLPSKFSFTQLKVFQTCPWQYRYAHILKVPTAGRFTFSYGKSIHQTLFDFFKLLKERAGGEQADLFGQAKESQDKLGKANLEELLEIYKRSWIDDWYDSKKHMEEYKKKGKQALKGFYQKYQEDLPQPKHLEATFNAKINDYTIKGVIDRVDKIKDGLSGVEIIDYKTGSVPKNKKDVDLEQLLIYAIACREVFKDEPNQVSYYYLDANKKMSFDVIEDEVDKVKLRVTETIEEMKKSDFEPNPGFHCKNCDFKGICEFRKL